MENKTTLADELNIPGIARFAGKDYKVKNFTFKELAGIQRRVGSFEAMDWSMLDAQLAAVHQAVLQTEPETTYDDVCALFPMNGGPEGFEGAFKFIRRVLALAGLVPDQEAVPGPNAEAAPAAAPSTSTPITDSSTTGASLPADSRPPKRKA